MYAQSLVQTKTYDIQTHQNMVIIRLLEETQQSEKELLLALTVCTAFIL